jgi:hypothetical protein
LLARTRSDHLVLAEYYSTVAKNTATTAQDRRRMAAAYRAGIRGMNDVAFTWDHLARLANKEARKAEEAANRHKQLATIA